MKVKRVTGGLSEVLEIGGRGALTKLGEPFDVKDEAGVALCTDGTGRFEAADAASQALVRRHEARLKAEAEKAAQETAKTTKAPEKGSDA